MKKRIILTASFLLVVAVSMVAIYVSILGGEYPIIMGISGGIVIPVTYTISTIMWYLIRKNYILEEIKFKRIIHIMTNILLVITSLAPMIVTISEVGEITMYWWMMYSCLGLSIFSVWKANYDAKRLIQNN